MNNNNGNGNGNGSKKFTSNSNLDSTEMPDRDAFERKKKWEVLTNNNSQAFVRPLFVLVVARSHTRFLCYKSNHCH